MGELRFLPNADPSKREGHASRTSFLLYRLGAFTVRLFDRHQLISEGTAPRILSDRSRTKAWGVGTILAPLAFVGAGIKSFVDSDPVINDVRLEIEDCVDAVKRDAPIHLQPSLIDDCEALAVPDPNIFDTQP